MPQEHSVVQCFQCEFFQVQIVKKTPKWNCKMCGAKQSLVQQFYKSDSAADCRNVCQDMNMQRGEIKEQRMEEAEQKWEQQCQDEQYDIENAEYVSQNSHQTVFVETKEKSSKWSKYL